MIPNVKKRFYREATVRPVEGGFTVALDDRPVRTPAGAPLQLPKTALAEAVAAEWAGQGEKIEPATMALMSLACTAIDLVAPNREAVVAEVAGYGAMDALCYRAEEPARLVEREQQVWQPLLDWAAGSLDAPLRTTTGLVAAQQPRQSLAALEAAVARHDDLELAALATAVKAAGSLLVGLALSTGRLDAVAAFEAAELHETHQIETWGEDPEATRRRGNVRADLDAAERFLRLLRQEAPGN